ncbi:putative long chain fatty acid coA ligase [Candidatus Accumulibacter aalborgensis]|uniref:Putative long chain fatty acid coA ligase n=1 Tax=Candidatus Accumulibacter aalborgensis TaxID=1860102 RepID=A0A1A8XMB1_9PROT|nr:putative long chain fatty acid coA ligase [Candidatus Accumulibacter aalborgensis]
MSAASAVSEVQSHDAAMAASGWTVTGLLRARSALTPDDIALWQLSPAGEWVSTRWSAYRQAVAALSAGFRKLGLSSGSRVGIMAPSCQEWDFAQLAVLAAGGVAVGLDPYALDEHSREISRRCDFVGLVLAHPSLLDKIDEAVRKKLRFVVCLDAAGAPGVVPLAALLAEALDDGGGKEDWNQAQADTPATIIFTSGTTGEPKGIEYSHRQVCLAASAILAAFPEVGAASRLACWLPLSNLFQRMINLSAIGRGAQTYYVSDPREVMRFIKTIAPDLFIGVPRFFEKLHAGIQEAIAQQPAWQQALVQWALRVGHRHASAARAGHRRSVGSRLEFRLADWLALGKLRGALGPNLRFMVSGSAPMPVWLLECFHAMGLPILEAYGISENIIPVSINRPDNMRFGTVGQAVVGCEVILAEDGELLVRGPGVFAGYLGEASAASALGADGYLASGDFATIDADGFITLVGRKSEIFKTSTGRRIAPASIESPLRQVPQLEHAVVFGARRAQPVALLVVSEAAWETGRHDLFKSLRKAVVEVIGPLPAYQRPAGLVITAQALTIAGGQLTANLKLRRHAIEAKHASALADLYRQIDAAAGARFDAWSADQQTFYGSP